MCFWISLILYFLYLFLKTSKNLQMLQQNRYNRGNKYLKWLRSNLKKNYWTWDVLGFVLFSFSKSSILDILFMIFYGILLFLFIYEKKKRETKLPLKFTGRIIRLFFTIFIFSLVPFWVLTKSEIFCYLLLFLFLYFNNLMVVLANIINIPVEKLIKYYFKRKSIKKLKSFSGLEVIGITGSYGKTSSKNILGDVLNIKYNALKSPENYNTPFGLMITINDYLTKYYDYFIAEMGACKKHEIKELCDLVYPKYGILTKIGIAHLETFLSIENIIKTKFELIESLPSDGIGILNADDENQINYHLENNCKIIWIGIENKEKADLYATNIKLSSKGTKFTVYFKKKKKRVIFETKLLGEANIYNLLSAIALGSSLGLTDNELVLGVSKVKPVEHRLNIKKYYDMYLIDDAYNANIDGAKMALGVLKLMKGKKIVITSGIIELGNLQYDINKELGKFIANCTDIAILIGEKQTEPIYDGLLEKKFKKENIYVFNSIKEGLAILQSLKEKETYILLQSDLPDIFNES